MKIAIFFDQYAAFHDAKDGNLIRALDQAGGSPTLVTLAKPELAGYEPEFEMVQSSRSSFVHAGFWRSVEAETVLVYTWLNHRYTPVLRAIAEAGKKIIVKADSDGRIGPPTPPYWYSRSPPWTREGATNLARRAAWRLIPRWMAARRLDHIAAADAVYFEAPTALANVADFVGHWGRPDLATRLTHIPIVVPNLFGTAPLGAKQRRVVCIGRWDDWGKNPEFTARSVAQFLERRPDHSAVMIGPGESALVRALGPHDGVADGRIRVVGSCSRSEVVRYLSESQILFMASRWEGFPLAVGEALSMGCSIAGTPIESLRYAVADGRFGTLAPGFEVAGLVGALLEEAGRWDTGEHRADAIAAHWRERFDPRRIGGRIMAVAEGLQDGAVP